MCILIYPPQGGEYCQFTVTTILMASGGLHPRVEVAGSGERAHLAGEHVEVGTADTHPFGSHDNVTGPGPARSGNVPDHHLAG
jgi:hypothetical protein